MESQTHQTQNVNGGGNTTTPPFSQDLVGQTHQTQETQSDDGGRRRVWQLTMNNPEDGWAESMLFKFKPEKYVWQMERGEAEETLHCHLHMYFKNARSWDYIKCTCGGAHIEKVKKEKESAAYCCKPETRVSGPHLYGYTMAMFAKNKHHQVVEEIEVDEPWGWQQELADIAKTKPDPRKIYWVKDYYGGVGKSTFQKWLSVKMGALKIGGTANDLKYAVSVMNPKPKIVCMNIPRSASDVGAISYGGMEEVKDGHFFSGKYESGQVIMNAPHMFVFANCAPDYDKMSADRWVEINIATVPKAPYGWE